MASDQWLVAGGQTHICQEQADVGRRARVAVLLLEFDSHQTCGFGAQVGKRVGEAAGNPGNVTGVLMNFFALADGIDAAQIEIRESDR